MKTLESLVPTLELCKKIPEGKFADSALVWFVCDDDIYVCPRKELGLSFMFFVDKGLWAVYPAPTLDEILEKLPKYDRDGIPLSVSAFVPYDAPKNTPSDTWRVGCKVNDSIWEKSAATAALRLWLELNKGDKNVNTDRFKFRVWSTKERSYDGRFHDSASIHEDGHLSVHYWCRGEYTTDILGDGFEEGDYIIEQCTGLRDKLGKLIYEGDIVLVYDVLSGENNKCNVQWNDADASFFCVFMEPEKVVRSNYGVALGEDETEIIGNIHERN